MASKLFSVLDDPSPCCCNNLCNRGELTARGTVARKGCPCFARGSFCYDACQCGSEKQICKNRPNMGNGDESEEDGNQSSDFEFDDEQLYVGFEDGTLIAVTPSLNTSLQEVAEEQIKVNGPDQSSIDITQNAVESECSGNTSVCDQSFTGPPTYRIENLQQTVLAQAMKEILLINPALKYVLDREVEASGPPETVPSRNEDKEQHCQAIDISERPPIPPYPDMESDGYPSDPPSPGSNSPGWCFCGRCREMPLPEEQVCCRRQPGRCVTATAANAFRFYIVERGVLRLFIIARNDWFAMDDDPQALDTLRHTAYRMFVLWKHGHLGAGRRVVIPSCVVWKIRDSFPSPDGQYTGFIPSRFN